MSRFLYLTDGAWRCAPCAGVVTAREAALRVVGKGRLSRWRRAIREGHRLAAEVAAGGGGPEALAAMVALELDGHGGLGLLPAAPARGPKLLVGTRTRETAENALLRYVGALRNGRTVPDLVRLMRGAGHAGLEGSAPWVRGTLSRWVREGLVHEQGYPPHARYWSPECRQEPSVGLVRARARFLALERVP